MRNASPEERIVCGFIGLGSQGAPIARRMIDAGYPMLLWARRPETLEPFRSSDARFASSIAGVGRDADHVAICVTDDNAVREVCDQLLPAMRPAKRLVIHSTILPVTSQAVAAKAKHFGIEYVEAPVSGGAPAAAAGTLSVMMAGDVAAVERARDVFQSFANRLFYLGDVGTAQAAKLINNSLMAANLGLIHSAIAIAEDLGIERDAALDFLKSSSGRSFALDVYARLPAGGSFGRGATLFEKVNLLAEVTGVDDPNWRTINDAARPLLDLAGVDRPD